MKNVLLDCAWTTPQNLLKRYTRFTPGNTGVWKGVKGVDDIGESDVVVCIGPKTDRDYKGRPVIQLRREPDFIEHFVPHPDAISILDYSDSGYHASTYHLRFSYDDLLCLRYPQKTKKCSLISSSKWSERNKVVFDISKSSAAHSIDFFGKSLDKVIGTSLHKGELDFPNSNYKEDALLPYQYSIAIENSKQDCYFSEKFIDCLLSWAMPIYWGCPNLEEYFPKESFIRFDHSHISDLVHLLDEPLSDINIEAMRYSRELALNKYALWPTIDRMINECGI